MIRAIIVSDNEDISSSLLDNEPSVFVEAVFSEPEEAFTYVKSHDVQVAALSLSASTDIIKSVVDRFFKEAHLPVVVALNDDDDDQLFLSQDEFPYAFITKPIRPVDLKRTLYSSLQRHHLFTEVNRQKVWIKSILNNVADLLLVVGTNKKIMYYNPATKNVLGDELSLHVQYSDLLFIYDKEGHSFEKDPILTVLDNKRNYYGRHYTIKTINGTKLNANLSISPLIIDGVNEGCVVGIHLVS